MFETERRDIEVRKERPLVNGVDPQFTCCATCSTSLVQRALAGSPLYCTVLLMIVVV